MPRAAAKSATRKRPAPSRRKGSARAAPQRRGRAASPTSGKKLVVVESPAKARTINRYLGRGYVVKASMGHVRDLPTKGLGVDLENDFAPTYEPLPGRKKILTELRKLTQAAPEVFLATDLDREGEAIAWHLAQALKIPASRLRRVIFNEITRSAIEAAFADPGRIDPNKVDAQQARRILDRIVGYQVSPLLWKKVAAGLSAGRVQTVAVRIIVERERALEAFMPEEFWKITAVFTPDVSAAEALEVRWREFLATGGEKGQPPAQAKIFAFLAGIGAFRAELAEWKGKRFTCRDLAAAREAVEALGVKVESVDRREDPAGKGPAAERVTVAAGVDRSAGVEFKVESARARAARTRPPAPFTTASMQQAASARLRFSASRTMRIAQQLYEGVQVPGTGSVGLITYMRTDSLNLSAQAVAQARDFVGEHFGERYLPDKPHAYRSSRRAQAAHEAIRPTDVKLTPESLAGALEPAQRKLYELIWRRFVSCQMSAAEWAVTELDVAADTPAGKAVFQAAGRKLVFDGYLKVAGLPARQEQQVPELPAGTPVAPVAIRPTQHFTQPPPRYTEASLVKALEAEGIGRPSTYAAIIQTIQAREYVKQIDRRFHATDLGMVVTDKLVKHFPDIFDVSFTARMEDRLDEIESAREQWVKVLGDFYGPFKADLERATEEMTHAKAETEPSEYKCPDCGKEMVYRWSRNGRYLACTGYPKCKRTFPVDKDGRKLEARDVDVLCPDCGGAMSLRQGRYGPFLGCRRYPDCQGVVNLDKKGAVKLPTGPPLEVDLPCPKCGQALYLRRGGRGPWLACSAFPKCRGRQGWKTLPPGKRKELEGRLAEHEQANPQPVVRKQGGTPVPAGYVPQEIEPASSEEGEEPK